MKQEQQAYISKTILQGNITLNIRRPILDEGELAERQKQITETLEHGLRDYLKRS